MAGTGAAGALALAMLTVLTLSACTASAGTASEGRIALLLPEAKTARYESFDRPLFTAKVEELCPRCEVVYSNAGQDPARQQQQGESALTRGADVLVLDAVDGRSAESLVGLAKQRGLPVLAYDRPVAGADFYLSFDNAKVGEVQAEALVQQLEQDGVTDPRILAIHGSPTDGNAADYKAGASRVFAEAGVQVVAEHDTVDWSPDQAQRWMESQLTTRRGEFDAVYAANDGTASGAIAAMKGAGIEPLPPATGQDAELAALQRLLSGDQFMTVYKSYRAQAEKAAEIAVGMLRGTMPTSPTSTDGVPSQLIAVAPVVRSTIADTVLAEGLWRLEDICTPDFTDECTAAGLR